MLIYIILKTNPANLYSNLMFIDRFRDPVKLQSEQGYYFTNMVCLSTVTIDRGPVLLMTVVV
jgi:hypothetical protein